MTAQRYDFIDHHASMARRVRNLETGVHPLRSQVDWRESIPPTKFPVTGGVTGLNPNTSLDVQFPRYQKRSGIGSLMGTCQYISDYLLADEGGLYGVLPVDLRPTARNADLVFNSRTPFTMLVIVQPSGQVRIKAVVPGQSGTFWFDGVTFPTA